MSPATCCYVRLWIILLPLLFTSVMSWAYHRGSHLQVWRTLALSLLLKLIHNLIHLANQPPQVSPLVCRRHVAAWTMLYPLAHGGKKDRKGGRQKGDTKEKDAKVHVREIVAQHCYMTPPCCEFIHPPPPPSPPLFSHLERRIKRLSCQRRRHVSYMCTDCTCIIAA